jgi:hypothetical protein
MWTTFYQTILPLPTQAAMHGWHFLYGTGLQTSDSFAVASTNPKG